MSSNFVNRTITCIVGIPLLAALIFLLPMHNFIGLSLFIIIVTTLGSIEMSKMVFGRTISTVILSSVLPLVQYIQLEFSLHSEIVYLYLVFSIILILAKEIGISGTEDDFKLSIERGGKGLLVLLYPAFLNTFLIKMFALEEMNPYLILLFLLLVFSNDIFAYVFGMLFGKKPKKGYVVKVSPKKSYAGFIGGHTMCIVVCFIWFAIFSNQLPEASNYFKFTLGLLISFTANIGDLLESVFKRSAGVKDSGKIVPGRGGVLDSIDSIMTSAPIFYLMLRLL